MVLLLIAFFGLLVPNGLFIYWLFCEPWTVASVLDNHLALAFILDGFMAMLLLAWLFARRPLGPVRWPWFIVLTLLGGLGFSIPFFLWLNERRARPRPAAAP